MSEKGKSEISPQKRSLKLTPLLGDWTTYKPQRSQGKKVKTGLYGFDRLSEEELNQAHLLHYNFAQVLCASIKTELRLGVELYSVEAQQNSYSNFLKIFTLPIFQGKFKSPEVHDEIFFAMDLSLVDPIINGALGSQDTSKLGRKLSEAEELVLLEILDQNLPYFNELFGPALPDLSFEKVGSYDVTPDSSISMQSTFVYFVIEMTINNCIGKVVFGYNGSFIKNLLKNINQPAKRPALQLNKLAPDIFNMVKVPVAVNIGKTNLTMNELHSLEINDVVSFDQNIEEAIPISLSNGHTIFGQIGKKDGKLLIRVVSVDKEKNVKIIPPVIETPEDEPLNEEVSAEEDIVGDESFGLGETEEIKEDEMEEEFAEDDLSKFDEEEMEEGTEEETEEEIQENEEEKGG